MSKRKEVELYVKRKIKQIEESGDKAAILARLRRAVGKEAGTVPDVWGFTLDLPEELQGKTDEPSYAEVAVFIALTLFAMHAQGKEKNMTHRDDANYSLGRSALLLKIKNPENEKGIKRRFDAIATAKTHKEIANHSRSMIQLLKASDIPLDYGRFAADLYQLQYADSAPGVKLRWGRDYHGYIDTGNGKEDENEKNNS